MRILFIGTPQFAASCLESVHRAGHEVALVATRPDAQRGRGRKKSAPAVKAIARQLDLEVYQPLSVNDTAAVERLRGAGAELGVVVAYGEILSPRALLSVPGGFVNVHASLLPKYRGAAPINWAVIRGERATGVTVVRMTPQLDAGPILAQCRVAIGDRDTAGDLHDRLCAEACRLLVEVLDGLAGADGVPEREQPREGSSYAPKLSKEDGRVDWQRSAQVIDNLVRGLTPWPGATSRFAGPQRTQDVTLLDVAPSGETDPGAAPGTILSVEEERGIEVQSGEGTVLIRRIKPASGRAMSGAEFARGRRLRAGDRFELKQQRD